jgi:hypothetical protein
MPLSLTESRNALNFKLKPWQTEHEAFQTSDLDQAVAEAVVAYSRSKPLRQVENLTVIAGQAKYSFPTGALRVQPCFFTSEDSSLLSSALSAPGWFDAESPASGYRALINQRYASGYSLQRVEVDEYQQKIILVPTPDGDTTGKIIVDYAHVLNIGGTGYDTILNVDKPFILNYAEGVLLKLLARAYSLNSNDVGDRKNRGLNLAGYLETQAEKLHAEFRKRFNLPVVERT